MKFRFRRGDLHASVDTAPALFRACLVSGLLLSTQGPAWSACIDSPGVSLQATAGSSCDAAGSYGGGGIPIGGSALGAFTGGIVNAADPITMSLTQNSINGVYATGAGSQVNLQGGLSLVRPGASIGIRGMRASDGGVLTVNGPLSITLSNGSSNQGIYAEHSGTQVLLNDSVQIDIGAGPAYSPGIRMSNGAYLETNGEVTVTTAGDSRSDAIVADQGASAQLNGSLNLSVSGTQAAALKTPSGGSVTYTAAASFSNSGLNGSGLRVVTGGEITAASSSTTTINTSGINGIGISVLHSGSRVNLAGRTTIRVTGATQADTPSGTTESYAAGLLITEGGALSATGSLSVVTTDPSSFGMGLLAGDPTIVASGGGSISAAGSAIGFLPGTGQQASLDGFSIRSRSGDLISVDDSTDAALTLRRSNVLASQSGNLLQAVNGSSITLTADASLLDGNVVASNDSSVHINLRRSSRLSGSIDQADLAMDRSSRWEMTSSSSLGHLALAGRIEFQQPGSRFAPQTLTVKGDWVGQGGVVKMRSVLGDSASLTDRIVIDGGHVSGNTTIEVDNAGGLGALTTGDGIMLVSAINGATTTAQTTQDGFDLAGGHVDAGAYEYRLYSGNASGEGENWYLRSTKQAPTNPSNPNSPSGTLPTYRAEVPLYASIASQLRQSDLAMLANLHQRMGDDGSVLGDRSWRSRSAWGRLIFAEMGLRQQGAAVQSSAGRVSGFQTGLELYQPTGSAWRAGLYAGQLEGRINVQGFARGAWGDAGSNDLRTRYMAAYSTWKDGDRYADAVLQLGSHRYRSEAIGNQAGLGQGRSLVASLEVGQAFELATRWRVEPQFQMAYQRVSLNDVMIPGARVSQHNAGGWMARLGARVRGAMGTPAGFLQPYARANLYAAGAGTDVAEFVADGGARTGIASATRHSTAELAVGLTLSMTQAVSIYGELGSLHALGGPASVKSSLQGSMGLRADW